MKNILCSQKFPHINIEDMDIDKKFPFETNVFNLWCIETCFDTFFYELFIGKITLKVMYI